MTISTVNIRKAFGRYPALNHVSLDIADGAYILQTGRPLMQGSANDIKGNPDVRKAYLGL